MRRTIREKNILFLCEDNTCLSQIAEAVAKYLSPPKTRIFSAGIKPSTIPSQVYKVMEELGINLSGQSSKGLDAVPLNEIDSSSVLATPIKDVARCRSRQELNAG